ncbi:ABC transporter permease [Aquimarina sp. AU474]|uniref:ABC transporter permease n=1 Tax=Aquimarina sp. AU474 TaxID=2108529 RepID=UPI000D68E783|nr:ABC transporter permease [Aquimarina sp. AU474]
MLTYFRILKESFNFAINALINHKFRSFLSLLGITIGIFSVILVLAGVDSLKQEIEGSLSGIDKNTVIVMRFPFTPTDIPQWKWQQFPDVTYDEYRSIKRNTPNLEAATFVMQVPLKIIKTDHASASNVNIASITYEYADIEELKIAQGRFFTESESDRGSTLIVIGDEIANSLFGSAKQAIGRKVKLYGRKFTVIGVLKKEGAALGDYSKDNFVLILTNFARKIYGDNNRTTFPRIIIKPKKGIDMAEFRAILTQRFRLMRGLKPDNVDTFFVNQMKGVTDVVDNITSTLNQVGLLISSFSLLVGGFGIANIMFMSVKERTNLIGIQKSLGAKNKFILLQFLFEAVILAIIGGLIGIFLVFSVFWLASQLTGEFEFILSSANILIGTVVSLVIGLISGILPAVSASRLNPVEAIRKGM